MGPVLLSEPSPAPHVAVIFSSVRLTDASLGPVDQAGYAEMAERMDALSREQPGYLGIDSARGADGLGITVSYWATEADAIAWKRVADHEGAQRLGRERWYREYTTRVATVTRSYSWQRDPSATDPLARLEAT
jgi:heme-degrading monooxygenase HmoA